MITSGSCGPVWPAIVHNAASPCAASWRHNSGSAVPGRESPARGAYVSHTWGRYIHPLRPFHVFVQPSSAISPDRITGLLSYPGDKVKDSLLFRFQIPFLPKSWFHGMIPGIRGNTYVYPRMKYIWHAAGSAEQTLNLRETPCQSTAVLTF